MAKRQKRKSNPRARPTSLLRLKLTLLVRPCRTVSKVHPTGFEPVDFGFAGHPITHKWIAFAKDVSGDSTKVCVNDNVAFSFASLRMFSIVLCHWQPFLCQLVSCSRFRLLQTQQSIRSRFLTPKPASVLTPTAPKREQRTHLGPAELTKARLVLRSAFAGARVHDLHSVADQF